MYVNKTSRTIKRALHQTRLTKNHLSASANGRIIHVILTAARYMRMHGHKAKQMRSMKALYTSKWQNLTQALIPTIG